MMEWATILDVIWGIVEAGGAGIKLAIDPDVPQAVAMETHLIKVRVIQGQRGSSEVTSPVSFATFDSL